MNGEKKMWLKFFGSVIVLVGLIFVFDARRITRKNFSSADENKITLGIKIFGALLIFVFGMLVFVNVK